MMILWFFPTQMRVWQLHGGRLSIPRLGLMANPQP